MISRFGAIDTDPVEAVKKINRLGTGSLIRFHELSLMKIYKRLPTCKIRKGRRMSEIIS
jgi:hypothetical protein